MAHPQRKREVPPTLSRGAIQRRLGVEDAAVDSQMAQAERGGGMGRRIAGLLGPMAGGIGEEAGGFLGGSVPALPPQMPPQIPSPMGMQPTPVGPEMSGLPPPPPPPPPPQMEPQILPQQMLPPQMSLQQPQRPLSPFWFGRSNAL